MNEQSENNDDKEHKRKNNKISTSDENKELKDNIGKDVKIDDHGIDNKKQVKQYGKYPNYVTPGNILFDLSRRDFTINAIAIDSNLFASSTSVLSHSSSSTYQSFHHPTKPMDLTLSNKGLLNLDSPLSLTSSICTIFDPFNGYDDIKNKILHCVGDAKERLYEDPVRIIRGIRFVIKYNLKIEDKTLEAMKLYAHLILTLPLDRVMGELSKCFMIDTIGTLRLLRLLNLDDMLFDQVWPADGRRLQLKPTMYTG